MVLNYRYLVLEAFSEGDGPTFSKATVTAAVKDSVLLNFGEFGLGASQSSLQVKYVNPITKLCIIRCSRSEYEKIWCAITFITSIGNHPVFFNLLDLSGNITCCKRAALEYDKAKFAMINTRTGNNKLSESQCKEVYSSLERISQLTV